MSFATRHNKTGAVRFVSFKDTDIIKMGTTYTAVAVGTKDGKYGEQPYVDLVRQDDLEDDTTYRLNLPKWMLEDIKTIANNAVDVADLEACKVGIKFAETKGKNGDTHTVEWVDL